MIHPEQLSGEEQLDPPNQELLNILRKNHPKGVGTSEIVDRVDLKNDAVRKRMRGLEAEGIVDSKTIGSQNDFSYVWYLADGERIEPVNPDIERLVEKTERFKSIGETYTRIGKDFVWASLTVIVLTLAATSQNISLPGVDPGTVILVGLGIAVGGVAVVSGGQTVKLLSILAERVGEWFVKREGK